MGILCELFVATRRNAMKFESRLDAAEPPIYERAEAKGLTSLEFETLWAILQREDFDPRRHWMEDLYFGSHNRSTLGRLRTKVLIWKAMLQSLLGKDVGSSWLHRFPKAYVSRLAELKDAEIPYIAATWSKTEEMASRKSVDLEELLRTLRRLANAAESSKRQMFVWGSV
jgi:hypothetical protein